MGDSSNLAQDFRNLDRTDAPRNAVRFLDALNTSQQVLEMQRVAHGLLGVKEGFRILDVGCGVGDVARELAGLVGPSGRVVGVDLSDGMVAEARKRSEGLGLPVEYHVGDIHRLDFPSESFDACRASRVFIYLEDPRQGLSELLRLARPGGAVVLFEPELDTWGLDGPNPAVVRRLVHFWADQLRNPWIGRKLPGLFRSLGVTELKVHPVVGTWLVSMLETFGMRAVLDKAVREGVATRAEVDEWLQFLADAERANTFYGTMSGTIICGLKPSV